MHHYIPSLFLGLLFLFANLGFAKSEEFKADELGRICYKLHEQFNQTRSLLYGNAVIDATEVSVTNGSSNSKRRSEVKFWSRESTYFRIDRTITESSSKDEVGLRTRLIVRPEGYVFMIRGPLAADYVIQNFGSAIEGKNRIYDEDFYAASTRTYRFYEAETPFGDAAKGMNLNPVSKSLAAYFTVKNSSKDAQGIIQLTSMFDYKESQALYSVGYDMNHGVVTHYHMAEALSPENPKKLVVDLTFDHDRFKQVPKLKTTIRASQGETTEDRVEVKSVSWEPVPIGVFGIGEQGVSRSNVWIRRLVILSVGIGLLGIYFAYRRVQNRA